MSTLKEQVRSNIRACIISCPNEISIQELNSDYHSLVGEFIPYGRLGFPTLEDLLLSEQGIDLIDKDGSRFVISDPSKSSRHIQELVQKQKNNKKPQGKPFFISRPYHMNGNRGARGRRGFKRGTPIHSVSPRGNLRNYNEVPRPHVGQQSRTSFWQPPRARFRHAPTRARTPRPRPHPSYYGAPRETSYWTSSSESGRDVMRNTQLPVPSGAFASSTNISHPVSGKNVLHCSETQEAENSSKHEHEYEPAQVPSTVSSKASNNEGGVTSSPAHLSRSLTSSLCVGEPASSNSSANNSKLSDSSLVTPSVEEVLGPAKKTVQQVHVGHDGRAPMPTSSRKPDLVGESPRTATFSPATQNNGLDQLRMSQGLECLVTSCYPQQFAADDQAIDGLGGNYDGSLSEGTDLPESTSVDVIEERILDILGDKNQGIWLYEIRKIYREKFNECLPKHLPELTKHSKTVEMLKLSNFNYVVRPRNFRASENRIEVVALPQEDSFEVVVSFIKNAHEIYIRLKEEAISRFKKLCFEMNSFYLTGTEQSRYFVARHDVRTNKYYAHVSDSVRRVLVKNSAEDRTCVVYFIDVGAVESVDISSLRVLQPSFYNLPAQAVTCFLEDLHNFEFELSEPSVRLAVDRVLMGKTFFTSVSSRNPVSVVLMSTGGDDEIINETIRDLFWKSFEATSLMEMMALKLVAVTSVDASGRVFVRVASWPSKCLNQILSLVNLGTHEAFHLQTAHIISPHHFYVYKKNPSRVKILKCSNDIAEVNLVDTGEVVELPIGDICDIPQLDDVLQKIPPQAVHVLLNEVQDGTLSSQQIEILRSMLFSSSSVLAKVVGYKDAPIVDLFVRNESNLLISVNKNIVLFPHLLEGGSIIEEASRKVAFNVNMNDRLVFYVRRVISPSEIIVIPFELIEHWKYLSAEMMACYSSTRVDDCIIQSGEFAAVFYNQYWCRARVMKQIDSDCFKLALLDVGCTIYAPKKAIRTLRDSFKKLTHLAFRARLHGIKPLSTEWEQPACHRLNELIHNKMVYGVVRDITGCGIGDRCLSLEIIDTITDEDLFISRQMVLEKLAVFLESSPLNPVDDPPGIRMNSC